MANEPTSLDLVNASGYPYQLRVAHEIENTPEEHGWSILATELRWGGTEEGVDGYADIVLERDHNRLILECKRVKEGTKWIFLVPRPELEEEDSDVQEHNAKLFWTHRQSGDHDLEGWGELRVKPYSYRSAFCIIDRNIDRSGYLLEKTCNDLLLSVEFIGRQELSVRDRSSGEASRFYAPILVTNADLEVCAFDPFDVSLATGMLPFDPPRATFRPTKFIRFQKSLASTSAPAAVDTLGQENAQDERTVFVVRGTALASFLRLWSPAFVGAVEPWRRIIGGGKHVAG